MLFKSAYKPAILIMNIYILFFLCGVVYAAVRDPEHTCNTVVLNQVLYGRVFG